MKGSNVANSTAEPKAEKTPAKERIQTTYVVLQLQGESVNVIGEGQGLNDIAAIGDVAGQLGLTEGDFVAVPTRSWRVRSVSVQTKRSVSIR